MDAGGGWHQWCLALVGGISVCLRWLVAVGSVGVVLQQWWWTAIVDVGLGCCLNQCLVHGNHIGMETLF